MLGNPKFLRLNCNGGGNNHEAVIGQIFFSPRRRVLSSTTSKCAKLAFMPTLSQKIGKISIEMVLKTG
jgi:hypothetical protein